jgi:endonuclease YncB( thermonuclease family)
MSDEIAGTVSRIIDGDTVEVEQKAVKLPELGWITPARITRVIDGDTIEFETKRTFTARLRNCWAPESHLDGRVPASRREAEKARGIKSAEHLRKLCEGKDVIVRILGDPNGDFRRVTTLSRVVADVVLTETGESLADLQVAAGHAGRIKQK